MWLYMMEMYGVSFVPLEYTGQGLQLNIIINRNNNTNKNNTIKLFINLINR